jgi:hypothetical protein
MKGKISFLVLLLLVFILGCQTERESITYQGRSWGEPSNGLRCSIAVEETSWSKVGPALVSVIIENVSEGKVNLKTIPSFTLKEDSMFLSYTLLNELQFYCPVDIVRGEYALPPNARSTISLDRGALINARIDVSKLKWGMGSAATWPDNSFYLVSPRRYKLRMDIEIVDGGLPKWIRSNEIEVDISE